ncbi:hypothetical protein [Aquirufa nivalisilvae]|uniref:hypothetical protein n=1 Tax=Aquirufa nivalisilvae TaxID=2516557 RepID=UPI001032A8AA|nr:hypothetical protein [Aquirufa nivalisilvae]TBH73869.1 hypothetical protein EWU22_09425 [Aquirufa nivalisilvae]
MEDRQKYTFELEASPFSWMVYAQELHEAANIIIANSSYEINKFHTMNIEKTLKNAFFLNFGLSIENLLKGILIFENPQYINDYKIDNTISRNHDLLNLAKEITTINFTDKEKKLLKFLSEVIPYWGKYPVPKEYKKIIIKEGYDELKHENLEKLWDKLIQHLYSKIKNGNWTSPNGINTGFFRDSTLEENFNSSIQELSFKINNGEVNPVNVDFSKTIYFNNIL